MSKIMRDFYAEARRVKEANDPTRDRRRYSVRKEDAGHRNYADAKLAGKTCMVYLDGALVHRAITADEVQGVVTSFVEPLVVVGNEVKTQTRRGAVLVELI